MAQGGSATAHAGWILLLLIAQEKDEACESSCRTGRPAEEAVPDGCECEPATVSKGLGCFFFFSLLRCAYTTSNEGTQKKEVTQGFG